MPPPFNFGRFEIRPDERRVLADGEALALGARAFDLLICLVEHRERVVAKDELLALVWPGMVVEENNLAVHVSAIRKLLGAEAVATVPGRGYRFALNMAEDASVPPAAENAAADAPDLSLPSRPSIAVLPFDPLSPDPDHIVDGLAEDLITELSRFRSLFVIGRNSSFSYEGKAVDLRTIARELGVRYVVEGSMRRGGDRIRVTTRLVEASSGLELWSERYDRALDDLFAVQEELTHAIVAAIAPQIESQEFQRLRGARPGNLTAYGLAMRARDLARSFDREGGLSAQDDALRLAREAVAIDPRCGPALGTIAYLHWRQLWGDTGPPRAEVVEAGLAAARQAIAIDAGDHVATLWKGMLQWFAGQHPAGLADLRRAHELNPNDPLTLSLLGQHEALAGDPPAGIRCVGDAIRLSPRDPLRWSFFNSLAWAHFAAGDDGAAVAAARLALADAPTFYPARLCLVLGRVGLGEPEAADFAALQALAPAQVAARLAGRWQMPDSALRERATARLQVAAGREAGDTADPAQ